MAVSTIKVEKYSLDEIDFAAEDFLKRCKIDETRVACVLETIEKVMHQGILLETCVKEGIVTEQEMKPLLEDMKSILDKNRSGGIEITPKHSLQNSILISPSPSHWKNHATILEEVIDNSIKSCANSKKKESLRKAVAEILLNEKIAGEVIPGSDAFGSIVLLRYARHAFKNAADLLGLEEADHDPVVESAFSTPLIDYGVLKAILASKQPRVLFSSNATLPEEFREPTPIEMFGAKSKPKFQPISPNAGLFVVVLSIVSSGLVKEEVEVVKMRSGKHVILEHGSNLQAVRIPDFLQLWEVKWDKSGQHLIIYANDEKKIALEMMETKPVQGHKV
uniref:Uncharacterized protein n=1 Tax=Ditylenchus dipsaci TaxID=166011 RepID=A0A915D9R0_9BILA